LHQESGTLAAKRRARDEPHTFLFRGQRHVGDVRIVPAQRD
jgi:hypothetical protein